MYARGNWGERSEPHTYGENGKLSIIYLFLYIYIYIYIYIYMVRTYSVYIYIMPHLCAMQYFHIACWFTVAIAQEKRLTGQKG